MKACWYGFCGTNHSWSIVAQNISRALIKKGHVVDMCSTNGLEHFPNDLKPYIKSDNQLDSNYDLQLSYTAPINFKRHLCRGSKNRFGIWCYEWPILPPGFAANYIHTDKILAPSTFARNIFIKNGVPEDKVVVVPHGVNLEEYKNTNKYNLKTKASVKILTNIGQPHLRKNIRGLFEAYGKAFTKKDDVCLVAKINRKPVKSAFEVDAVDILKDFQAKFKDHAEIELITSYVPNIVELYNACDIVYTMSHSEAFYMPGYESLLLKKINVCPRYGGQLDFLNDNNSILIDGKIARADTKMQYWKGTPYNECFYPDTDDAANKLKLAVNHVKNSSFNLDINTSDFDWSNIADQILSLTI